MDQELRDELLKKLKSIMASHNRMSKRLEMPAPMLEVYDRAFTEALSVASKNPGKFVELELAVERVKRFQEAAVERDKKNLESKDVESGK